MVKPSKPIPPEHHRVGDSKRIWVLLTILITGIAIFFGLPPFLEEGPAGGYILSKERQGDFDRKPLRSEEVEVYRLVAVKAG